MIKIGVKVLISKLRYYASKGWYQRQFLRILYIFWYCYPLRDVILYSDLSKLAFLWQIVSLNYSNPLWRILVFCFKTPPMNTSIRSPSVLWGIEGYKSASEGSSLLGVPDSIRCQWQILQPSDRCVLACNGFGWFQGERVPSPLYTGIAFVIMSPTQLTCVVFPT